MLAVQVSQTNGSSSTGRLQWRCGVVLCVVPVGRVVLAEYAVLLDCAVPVDHVVVVDGAVLTADVGL